MKKILIALILSIVMVGCSQSPSKTPTNKVPESLVGEWSCKDDDYSYYVLDISKDGHFSMYDCEAGNPGISGTMSGEGNQKGVLDIQCDEDDFDPPSCWQLEYEDQLEFEFVSDGIFTLTHNSESLTFVSPEKSHAVSSINLIHEDKGYLWEMSQSGTGSVDYRVERNVSYPGTVDTPGVDVHSFYIIPKDQGEVDLTFTYQKGNHIKYTVIIHLNVLQGTCEELSEEGDLDQIKEIR